MSDDLPDETVAEREDVVVMLGENEQGHLRALRARDGEVALAELRQLEDGQPIVGDEIISLREREGSPVIWDVDVVHRLRPSSRKGPARVASAAYRNNWEQIFGVLEPPEDDEPLN